MTVSIGLGSRNNMSHTGSSRKNDKSKSRSRGVYFYKILIFTPVPGRKIAKNYSPTPSKSFQNVLRLPSKVSPPTLAEWKSGTVSPKRASKQPKNCLWPVERSELGSKQIFIVAKSVKISTNQFFTQKISTKNTRFMTFLNSRQNSVNAFEIS